MRPVEEVAHEHPARLLALDLARVDAVEHEHDREADAARLRGGADAVRGEDEEGELAAPRAMCW